MADVKLSDKTLFPDVKWSDNTAFPEAASIDGTEEIVGLKSGNNMKANVSSKLLPYFNSNVQLPSTAKVTGLDADLTSKLNISGGTMTGDLILNAPPTVDLQAATKKYVDDSVVSDGALLIANNLSDVNSILASANNLGVGNNAIYITGGEILTAPLPRRIGFNISAPGQTLQLPDATTLNANVLGDVFFIDNYSAYDVSILDGTGAPIATINAVSKYWYTPDSNITVAGTWYFWPWVGSVNSSTKYINTVDLESVFNQGNGSLTTGLGKPLQLLDGSTSLAIDAASFFDLISNENGCRPFPQLTTVQRDAITSPPNGLFVYNITTVTLDYFNGSTWQTILTLDNVIQGTNISITNNGDGTITIASTGSPLNAGSYAVFNISSGAVTTFSNSGYKPVITTVNTSSGLNVNINSDGTIEILQAGTYKVSYVLTARSSTLSNVFAFSIAINGTADTHSLQAPTLPTSTGNSGSSVVVSYTYTFSAHDIVQLYVANIGTLSNNLIVQTMICSISEETVASAIITGQPQYVTNIDVTLTNPPPSKLVLTYTDTAHNVLLPPLDDVLFPAGGSFYIENTNSSTQNANLQLADSTPVGPLPPNSLIQVFRENVSIVAIGWSFESRVASFNGMSNEIAYLPTPQFVYINPNYVQGSQNGTAEFPFLDWTAAITYILGLGIPPAANYQYTVFITGDVTDSSANISFYPFVNIVGLGESSLTAQNILWDASFSSVTDPILSISNITLIGTTSILFYSNSSSSIDIKLNAVDFGNSNFSVFNETDDTNVETSMIGCSSTNTVELINSISTFNSCNFLQLNLWSGSDNADVVSNILNMPGISLDVQSLGLGSSTAYLYNSANCSLALNDATMNPHSAKCLVDNSSFPTSIGYSGDSTLNDVTFITSSYMAVTSTTQQMEENNTYCANNAALVTLTLPINATEGSEIKILGKGAGGWLIAQNAGQSIIVGTSTSTPGVGGSVASQHLSDCIILTSITADTTWIAYGIQGSLTII